MKTLLLLLLAASAHAAPLVGSQDLQPNVAISSAVSIGTTTAATSALTVYGLITSSTTQGTIACNAGTPTLASTANDNHGSFTSGTAAVNCTYTFKTPWNKVPDCFCTTNAAVPITLSATPLTTSVKCTSASALTGDTIYYFCIGEP